MNKKRTPGRKREYRHVDRGDKQKLHEGFKQQQNKKKIKEGFKQYHTRQTNGETK